MCQRRGQAALDAEGVEPDRCQDLGVRTARHIAVRHADLIPVGVLDPAVAAGHGHARWQLAAWVREAVFAQRWTGPAGAAVVGAGIGLWPTEQRSQPELAASMVACLVGMLVVTGAAVAAWRGLTCATATTQRPDTRPTQTRPWRERALHR